MLRVVDFHKVYRETIAVAGLTFEVAAGQVLGLVGPNGAGKTTTLRSIAGIIRPTRGQLTVGGHDVVADPIPAKSLLAYVPDEPKLFDTLTVWEHLHLTASIYGLGQCTVAATRLLERFELLDKRDTVAHELSRGMRQKVAVCCAYLHAPQLVLFDEPLTGLDPHGIRGLKNSIIERAAAGVAVVISSHLLALVEDLCSHLLILHRGQSAYFGPLGDARAAFADLSPTLRWKKSSFALPPRVKMCMPACEL
jgi:ABC-2 type transport system ATP-binding protein